MLPNWSRGLGFRRIGTPVYVQPEVNARLEALICQAVEGGATTATEILEPIEPQLRVRDSSKPVATNDPVSGAIARDKAVAARKRLKDRIRRIVERMKRDPGKVRGQVKAEHFGFPTSTDNSGE